ncbi:MAG: DUF5678 domain-containing protein [Candidatus Hydrothermarchaeales archaeon]
MMDIPWDKLKKYRGLWVAVEEGKILASGKALKEVVSKVEGVAKKPEIFQVPIEEEVYILCPL